MLNLALGLVVQKMRNSIHRITQLISLILIRWIVRIVIYPVDNAVQRLNNQSTLKLINDRHLMSYLLFQLSREEQASLEGKVQA